MRSSLCVGLVTVCLGLAGCSLFNRRANNARSEPPAQPTPFLGSPARRAELSASADRTAPPSDESALLAGTVLGPGDRRFSKIYIQVDDLDGPRSGAARVSYEVKNQDGYFTIQGLKRGHHYQLIARGTDGERDLTGTTQTVAPNTRLAILMTQKANSRTPAMPRPPTIPGRTDGEKGTDSPASSLDGPGQPPPDPPPSSPSAHSADPGPTGTAAPDPTKVVQDPTGGWERYQPPPPLVNVHSGVQIPPEPNWRPAPDSQPPAVAPGSGSPYRGPSSRLPVLPLRVPSCQIVGGRLENFVLYDLDGRPWEFRRQKKGKLVLLDFWYCGCSHCLTAIRKHLTDWDEKYRPWGLEVIGVGYERGPLQDQANRVRQVRPRLGIKYTTLLANRPAQTCPLASQLGIGAFPTLVLLDQNGKILYRKEGLDARAAYELEMEIRRRLGIP